MPKIFLVIPQALLLSHGATFKKYKKDQFIFTEGDYPFFCYEVAEGSVRMVNIYSEGKEFIQGIFKKGESFGEPVIDKPYPSTAIANESSLLIRISKKDFIHNLRGSPDIHLSFTCLFALRLFDTALVLKEMAGKNTEHRILTMLQILKKNSGSSENKKYKVEQSRQMIAAMTGLRVETVIRTIKKLESKGVIKVFKGKVFV